MQAFFNDFVKLGPRPELGLEGDTLLLGAEHDHPELTTLQPNERMVITDEVELWAVGEAVRVVDARDGTRWWYAQRIPTWHYLAEEPLPEGTTIVAGAI